MKQLERVERGTTGDLIRRAMLRPGSQSGMHTEVSHRPFLASLASCPSLFLHALPYIANSVASEPR